jgi:hypothetical protein
LLIKKKQLLTVLENYGFQSVKGGGENFFAEGQLFENEKYFSNGSKVALLNSIFAFYLTRQSALFVALRIIEIMP